MVYEATCKRSGRLDALVVLEKRGILFSTFLAYGHGFIIVWRICGVLFKLCCVLLIDNKICSFKLRTNFTTATNRTHSDATRIVTILVNSKKMFIWSAECM